MFVLFLFYLGVSWRSTGLVGGIRVSPFSSYFFMCIAGGGDIPEFQRTLVV